MEIYKISSTRANEIQNNLDKGNLREDDKCLFLIKDKDVFVGIDNTTFDGFTEEFETENDCIAWLKGEFDIDAYPYIKLLRRCKDSKYKDFIEKIISELKRECSLCEGEYRQEILNNIQNKIKMLEDILELLCFLDEDMIKL